MGESKFYQGNLSNVGSTEVRGANEGEKQIWLIYEKFIIQKIILLSSRY